MNYGKVGGMVATLVVAAGLSGYAFAQGAPAAQGGGGSQGQGYAQSGSDANAAGPSGATRPLEVPVMAVTGIEVMHATLDPKVDVIRVTGLVSSAGWTGPTLVPFFYGKPADDVLDLQFIATSPEQSQKAEGFQPISADFTLEAGHPFKGVRVRAYANALELKQMNGNAQAQIKANDCKDCIGKTFVDKGQGQPGPGVVYGGDLPPDYRPIGPTHGVKGDVHNPNRINLILDGQNKIVMAFWE
ncbi:MAG: hypothetical protein JO032_12580 [Alphaproteobacteria bacterium]|nr:hypothetical protein [Alphaproteobacteria bacterium]